MWTNLQLAEESSVGCSGATCVILSRSSAVFEYFLSSRLCSLFSATAAALSQLETIYRWRYQLTTTSDCLCDEVLDAHDSMIFVTCSMQVTSRQPHASLVKQGSEISLTRNRWSYTATLMCLIVVHGFDCGGRGQMKGIQSVSKLASDAS